MIDDLNVLDDVVRVERGVLSVDEDDLESCSRSDFGSCDRVDSSEETDERSSCCLSVCESFLEVGRLKESREEQGGRAKVSSEFPARKDEKRKKLLTCRG